MLSTEALYSYYTSHPLVSTDTRHLPAGCIFFALKGPHFNGNQFALKALADGAAYAVVDEDAGNDHRLLRVNNVLESLQQLATYHRQQLDLPVLAITGSNGKTTSKELCAAVLKMAFETLYTQGNLNNHIGVPLTLLQLTEDHDFAVIEMGANHQQEIAALCAIAQPDYGLITNIGKAHLEGFGGEEGVKKGKGEMYDFLRQHEGIIFIKLDNPVLRTLLQDYEQIISYGEDDEVDYCGHAKPGRDGLLEVEIVRPFKLAIRTQLTGDYNLDNVLAAVAVGAHFGVPPEDIQRAIQQYVPGNQRSQLTRLGDLCIVQDTYNANPSSMMAALDNFSRNFNGEKWIALGEMLELGSAAVAEHLKIARTAVAIAPERVLLVGNLFKEAAKETGCLHFEDSSACAAWMKSHKPAQGYILIKGSRGSKMERMMEAFSSSD